MDIKWFFSDWFFELIGFSKKLFESHAKHQSYMYSNGNTIHKIHFDDNRPAYDKECRLPNTKYYIDKFWYKRFSDSGILVSRRAAAKKIGRKLKPWEVVHHINKNKIDNNPDNLSVFSSWAEHNAFHKADTYKYTKSI